MKRITTAHKLIYYIKNNTSEKYPVWRSVTIDFLQHLFELTEKNPGINLYLLKTAGLCIFYKSQQILYMRINKKSFTVYLHPEYLLNKISDRIFISSFDSDWYKSYKVSTEPEVTKIIQYLSKLNVITLSNDLKKSRRIPTWVKEYVFERDSGKCQACGSSKSICYDHILPYSKGGLSNHPKNIQLLCERCNLKKSDKFGIE